MKKFMLLALIGLIISTTNSINAATKSFKYGSREERIASKRVRTKSDERRQRYEQALAQTEKNMNRLGEKAEEEINNMSPQKKAQIAQDVARVKNHMAQIMARLKAMSPEERNATLIKMNAQKEAIMNNLSETNPEVYAAFKAMEEMGNALQEVNENQ